MNGVTQYTQYTNQTSLSLPYSFAEYPKSPLLQTEYRMFSNTLADAQRSADTSYRIHAYKIYATDEEENNCCFKIIKLCFQKMWMGIANKKE